MLISPVETVDNSFLKPVAADDPVDVAVDGPRMTCGSGVHNSRGGIREFTRKRLVIQREGRVLPLIIHRVVHSCGFVYEIPGCKPVETCG